MVFPEFVKKSDLKFSSTNDALALQLQLDALYNWCEKNCMQLNPASHVMRFFVLKIRTFLIIL